MKRIFIYYSNTGNGDLVAEYLKEKEFEIRKVETTYKLSKHMFFAMMKGGYDALRMKEAELLNYNDDLSEYDEVFIGSPIWNGRLTPPINSVLKQTNLDNKKVTFILYSGGGEAKKAESRIKELYSGSIIINLKQPIKYKEELDKIDNYLK